MVLDDFNLDLPAGKVTALCGLSGAGITTSIAIVVIFIVLGKSTVAALLERFYDIELGGIYIDGRWMKLN